jgi:hypothetical protein
LQYENANWIATIRDLFKKKIATKNARIEVSIIGNSKRISEINETSWRCNLAEALSVISRKPFFP